MREMFALIRFETRKALSQNKCLLGVLTIVLINAIFVLGFFIKQKEPGRLRALGPELMKEIFNCVVYLQTLLAPCTSVLFPVLIGVIVSYIFSGEYEIGSLRLTMSRPVSRLKILMAKWCAVAVYSAAMLFFLLGAGYLFSMPLMKPSGEMILLGEYYGLHEKLIIHPAGLPSQGRLILSYILAWPMLLSISSMAFMFSAITRSFALSAILSCVVYLSCYVASVIPILSGIHGLLPTRYMPFWKYALLKDIPWDGALLTDALWTLAFSMVFMIIAYLFYEKADF